MDTTDSELMRDEFPGLRIDDDQDPFRNSFQWGSPTAQHIFRCSLIACGATSLDELKDRLSVLQASVVKALGDTEASTIEPFLYGFTISPQGDPGLMVAILTDSIDQTRYPVFELHASLAVWLMLEAHKALSVAEVDEVSRFVLQASICLAYCFGEGGRSVVRAEEAAARTERAQKAGSSPRVGVEERNERMREEFRNGGWKRRSLAIESLAKKYSLSFDHVDKIMKGTPFTRKSSK